MKINLDTSFTEPMSSQKQDDIDQPIRNISSEAVANDPLKYWIQELNYPNATIALNKIKNVESYYAIPFEVLNSIFKKLSSGIELIPEDTTFLSRVKENVECVNVYLNDVLKTTQLTNSEKEVIDSFENKLCYFLELVKLHNKIDLNQDTEVSEELTRFSVFDLGEYFKHISDWMEKINVYERYIDAKKIEEKEIELIEMLEGKRPIQIGDDKLPEPIQEQSTENGLRKTPEAGLDRFRAIEFNGKKGFVGIIHKDSDTGNCLYITRAGFLCGQGGERITKPIDSKDVTSEIINFTKFKELGERKRENIDIELPIDTSLFNFGECLILPTPLGFTTKAISLTTRFGYHVPLDGVTIKRDALGVSRLYNVPSSARYIRYRLTETSLNPIKDVQDEWLKNFGSNIKEDDENTFLGKLITNAKNKKEIIPLIRAKLQVKEPVYSVYIGIEQILASAKNNFYDVEDGIGLIGRCEHMATYLANEFRKYNIPAIVISGETIENTRKGTQFRSDMPHAQTLYLDEEGRPHIEEATTLDSKYYTLDEKQVNHDKYPIFKMMKTLSKERLIKNLENIAPKWRIPNTEQTKKENPILETSGILLSTSPSNTKDRKLALGLQEADAVQRIINSWDSILKRGDVKQILQSFARVERSNLRKILYAPWTGVFVHDSHDPYNDRDFFPLITFLGTIDMDKLTQDFKEWFLSNPKEKQIEIQHQLIHKVSGGDCPGRCLMDLSIVFSEFNKEVFNKFNSTEIRELAIHLNTSGINSNIKLYFLEELFQKANSNKDRETIAHIISNSLPINSNIANAVPPSIIRDSCIFLRSKNKSYEDLIKERVIQMIVCCARHNEKLLHEQLNSYYKSGVLQDYVTLKNGKVILTDNAGRKVAELYKKRLLMYIDDGESINHNVISSHIKTLESISVDLKKEIQKEEIYPSIMKTYRVLVKKYSSSCASTSIHTQGGYDYEKSASILVSELLKTQKPLYDWAKTASFLCDYFGIERKYFPDADISEEKVWQELKKILDSLSIGEPKAISAYNLWQIFPHETLLGFMRESNDIFMDTITSFIENSELRWKHNESLEKAYNSLCKKHPEAEKIFSQTVHRTLSFNHKNIIRNFIENSISPSTQHRFGLLHILLNRSSSGEIYSLEDNLREIFASKELPSQDVLQEAYKEAFSLSKKKYLWDDIKNELLALNEQELKTLSGLLTLNQQNYPIWDILPDSIAEDYVIHKNLIISPPHDFYGSLVLSNTIAGKIHAKHIHARDRSFWVDYLFQTIVANEPQDESKFFLEGGEYHRYLKDLISKYDFEYDPNKNKTQARFISLNSYNNTGSSKILTKTNSKSEHITGGRFYAQGDPIGKVDWRASARRGDDKLVVKEMQDTKDPSPYHYVVDLEILSKHINSKNFSEEVLDLTSMLCTGMNKNQKQHLHLFYRGNHIVSLKHEELREMLSNTPIEDELGKRTKFMDFILGLNFLANCTKEVCDDTGEISKGYQYQGSLVSNTWLPNIDEKIISRGGTVRVFLGNKDVLNSSMELFQLWKKNGMQVSIYRTSNSKESPSS